MPIRFYKRFALNAAALFLLIVAALFGREELYLMSATLFLIPLVSHMIGRALMRGLACERAGPTTCSEGEQIDFTLTLSAVGALPKCYVTIHDGLPRWLRPIGVPPAMILQLWPGESAAVTYTMEPQKRGVYALGPVQVTTTDPLGFFSYKQFVSCTTELVVYPDVLPLRQLFGLEGAGDAGREALDDGLRRGDSLEFHGVREYRPGDDLRRVHWRTTARTRKLAVMEFEQGQMSDACLALDLNQAAYADTGDGPESALEYALKITAAVALFLLRGGYGVSILSPATLDLPLSLRGPEDMPRLLDLLARAQADSSLTLADILRGNPNEGGTLVFVTPDAASPALSAALQAAQVVGTRAFGFALTRASFLQEDKHSAPDLSPLPTAWVQAIRRGDDLIRVLEGVSYARW